MNLVAGDPLTGWATVGLAVVAVATLVYSVIAATRDRTDADRRIHEQRVYDYQRAQRDRADAEARLAAERNAAEWRLQDERAYLEKTRQRERQQDSAARLLERIGALLPLMNRVPNLFRLASAAARGYAPDHEEGGVECERAVEGLRFGGFADLPGLGDARAAEQYRTLVHLVLSVARDEHQNGNTDETAYQERAELVALDLGQYATFVRLSLENLIEQGASFDPGDGGAGVSFPMLSRRPGDRALWFPPNVPQSWPDAVSRDPNDPQYRPAQ